MRLRLSAGLLSVVLLACSSGGFEPLPDNETDGISGGDSGVKESVEFDGAGEGHIYPPVLSRNAVVMGAPKSTFGEIERTGQLTIVVDDGTGHVIPESRPHRIIEAQNDQLCINDHHFAWELSSNRQLGSSLAFYVQDAGSSFSDYTGQIATSAATAAGNSGRALLYPGACRSCAIFPKMDGQNPIFNSRFGTNVAFGFFGDPDEEPVEKMLVGAPFDEDGIVAVLDEEVFRHFELGWAGTISGIRECQCDFDANLGNYDCQPWSEALNGSFINEEFGASLSVADFDCSGTDDVAIGAPGADLPMQGGGFVEEAGAVYAFLNAPPEILGGATILRQGALEVGGDPEQDDRFGTTLIAGNFNGARLSIKNHSCYDLVVATPAEDDGIGEIQIFEGSPDGLTFTGPIIRIEDIGLGTADPGDRFGQAMTAGDFNQDGFDDLAISAPGDSTGGSVTVIPGSPSGLRVDLATLWAQEEAENEVGDEAGFALTWTRGRVGGSGSEVTAILVIGIPGEDNEAGAVHAARFSFNNMLFLGSGPTWTMADFGGTEISGDRFGETLMPARAMPMQPWEYQP